MENFLLLLKGADKWLAFLTRIRKKGKHKLFMLEDYDDLLLNNRLRVELHISGETVKVYTIQKIGISL